MVICSHYSLNSGNRRESVYKEGVAAIQDVKAAVIVPLRSPGVDESVLILQPLQLRTGNTSRHLSTQRGSNDFWNGDDAVIVQCTQCTIHCTVYQCTPLCFLPVQKPNS
jgi:hypothetical protein